MKPIITIPTALTLAMISSNVAAEITLEKEIALEVNGVPSLGLYFNGVKKASTSKAENEPDVGPHQYDYMYGSSISPHGDCIKVYKNYVFMTWYRGGKQDRKLMLTRYNMTTGTSATIEFPHRHSGYSNRWWVGETHNTIGLGLSPKDETIHMVFDQHSLSPTNPSDGSSKNDYFKYYYSKPNSLTVPDDEFTLELFVKDDYFDGNDPINPYDNPYNETDEYKHITLTGEVNASKYQALSYPKFSLTDSGNLYLLMRKGRSGNGGFMYNKYDGEKWLSSFRYYNYTGAKGRGNAYDYGVYGEMKYAGGKLGVGFQQRINPVVKDRYQYQNGFFGSYFDETVNMWKNWDGVLTNYDAATGKQSPLINTDEVKISEPGDQVKGDVEITDAGVTVSGDEIERFSMVGSFDWNVTDRGDVHFIGKVTDRKDSNSATKHTYVHTYRPAGSDTFITTTDFAGAEELYAAGDNVYLIGLTSSGRPYVEKAEGGTNNFERIYAPTSGRTFKKGVPYISEGKLYYYLLEKKDAEGNEYTSDARPLYLQIIDLDLGPTEPALTVKFNKSSMTVDEGYQELAVKVDATTTVEGRTVEKVELYINDTFIQEATANSYTWEASQSAELLGLALGDHTLKAVVTDNAGDTSEATMTITVKTPPKPPTISFPDPELTVVKGYEQLTITLNVDTQEPGRSIASVTLKKDDQVIKTKTKPSWNFGHAYAPYEFGAMGWISCDQDPKPTPCHEPNPNPLGVGTYVFEAVVEDSEGLTSSAFLTLRVIEEGAVVEPTDPTISFVNTVTELTEGYAAFSVSVDAAVTTDAATITKVELYVGDNLVSADDTAPYQWSDAALQGLTAGTHTIKAVVTDSNGLTAEATLQVTVEAAKVEPEPEPKPGDKETGAGEEKSGGGSMSIAFVLLLALFRFSPQLREKLR